MNRGIYGRMFIILLAIVLIVCIAYAVLEHQGINETLEKSVRKAEQQAYGSDLEGGTPSAKQYDMSELAVCRTITDYEYDKEGKLTGALEYSYSDHTTPIWGERSMYTYEYDDSGRLIKKIITFFILIQIRRIYHTSIHIMLMKAVLLLNTTAMAKKLMKMYTIRTAICLSKAEQTIMPRCCTIIIMTTAC